jgi:hypothetical protein
MVCNLFLVQVFIRQALQAVVTDAIIGTVEFQFEVLLPSVTEVYGPILGTSL